MSEVRKKQIAKEYIDRQLKTMKQYGSAPRELSKQEYEALIKKAAKIVQT